MVSPQRAQPPALLSAGIRSQQRSQIGTEERRAREAPQRVHEAGRRVQPNASTTASTGLRSTRTTARQRVISDGGSSTASEAESLRKTHLNPDGSEGPGPEDMPRDAVPSRPVYS